ncbi:MAG: hypothetical protein ABIQ52_20700, partial [Vicinamibacterales bacterium]
MTRPRSSGAQNAIWVPFGRNGRRGKPRKAAVWGRERDPLPGDIPVPGDYDGNGVTDIAVFRPSAGQWFVRNGGTFGWGVA